MTAEYSVDEVRAQANYEGRASGEQRTYEMLTAYAKRIEADERAAQVEKCCAMAGTYACKCNTFQSTAATHPHSPDAADSGWVDGDAVERAAKAMWEVVPRGAPWSDEVTSANEWRMLARAALAAQGQGEIDLRQYVRNLTKVLEAGVGMWTIDADLQRLAAAINANLPAPPASPAGVPDGWMLVPRGLTPAMRAAWYDQPLVDIEKDWAALLAAAPSAPEGGEAA